MRLANPVNRRITAPTAVHAKDPGRIMARITKDARARTPARAGIIWIGGRNLSRVGKTVGKIVLRHFQKQKGAVHVVYCPFI